MGTDALVWFRGIARRWQQTARPPIPGVVGDSYAARHNATLAFAIVVIVACSAPISVQVSATLEADVSGEKTALSDIQADQLGAWLTTTERDVRTTSGRPIFATGAQEEIQTHQETMVVDDEVPPDVVAVHYVATETKERLVSSNTRFAGVLWLGYPVIWLLNQAGIGLMDVETTSLAISYLDVVTKVCFGFIALYGCRARVLL